MVLCPKCGKELKEGTTTCPGCEELLVDSIGNDSKGSNDQGEEVSEETDDQEGISLLRSTSKPYVMKEDQYRDLQSTAWIFLVLGLAGLVVIILNIVGILTFFQGLLPNLTMGALFLFFVYVGLSTHRKARSVYSEIDAENKLTEQINDWLMNNVTRDFLSSVHDPELTEEENYIKTSDIVKEKLEEIFGKQDSSYLDLLYEKYYTDTFDYPKID